MDFEDEGLYQCEATNAIGQTPEKHQIQVQVQAKPRFKVNLLYKCFLWSFYCVNIVFTAFPKAVKNQ